MSTFLNRYADFRPGIRLSPEFSDGFSFVLKRVHPIPAKARQKPSIVSIRSPVSRENREIEQQFQWLELPTLVVSVELRLELKNTSLNKPLESFTKERRWFSGAAARDGKGRGTTLSGKEQDDSSDDEDHDEGNEEGDVEDGEKDDGG